MKHIIILSSKSSGSTALIKFILRISGVNSFTFVQHQELESLYWTKAASVLRLPQSPMYRSVVPFNEERASNDLLELEKKNLGKSEHREEWSEAGIFTLYREIAASTGEEFVEKSPHHLYQESSLNLIRSFMAHFPEDDYLVIGLVRHPMDVLYSAWSRWLYIPEEFEEEWIRSYENLKKARDLFGTSYREIRYEDLGEPDSLSWLYEFLGQSDPHNNEEFFRNKSKWEKDSSFGYSPSVELQSLASHYKYEIKERSSSRFLWNLSKLKARGIYRLRKIYKWMRK